MKDGVGINVVPAGLLDLGLAGILFRSVTTLPRGAFEPTCHIVPHYEQYPLNKD